MTGEPTRRRAARRTRAAPPPGGAARSVRVHPGSSIALLFASLVVSAHAVAHPSAAGVAGRGGSAEPAPEGPNARPNPGTGGASDAGTGAAPAPADGPPAGSVPGAAPDPERGAGGDVLRSAPEARVVSCAPALWRRAIADERTGELARLLGACAGADLADASTERGRTALMVAAKADDAALARALLDAGADPSRRNRTGGTALMFAALGTGLEVARLLHAAGADPDVPAANGWTALTVAAARGRVATVRWLLSIDADPALADVYGFTPLMRAVDNDHEGAARALVEAAPGLVDRADESGNTALHHAAGHARAELAALLLGAGADPGAPNRDGTTPRELAAADPSTAAAFAAARPAASKVSPAAR